jgi:hypothetical protein
MPSYDGSFPSFLQPLVLSIVGGAIVAFTNHGFQTRREFIKSRREKLENIAQRVDNLAFFAKNSRTRQQISAAGKRQKSSP